MAKLTASQLAAEIGKTSYTIKRWYTWYESLSPEHRQKLVAQGMPELPNYEVVGTMNWRYWNDTDVDKVKEFNERWIKTHNTKRGVMSVKSVKN